ncbi:MAG: ferrous iron transport protein B, partial [Oscillospiraceae bacterium]|nr:ferrous iron transport protein B [Oscillospiraceae bacterium]
MKLSELEIGASAEITGVGGDGALRQHFLDMGVIPGASVTLIKYAPMGDPMELLIHGYELTLRIDDAKKIDIIPAKRESDEAHGAVSMFGIEHPGYGEGGRYHVKADENPLPPGKTLTFALAGNQNCGKTTLVNQLTGSNQHVGNFPGVTVDRKSGPIRERSDTLVTDLPGIYSLSPYTAEEIVSRKFILEEKPTGIINIVDATNIERNLYLTSQLIDMNLRTVMALNMYDELRARGDSLDIKTLGYLLGMPVIPTVSRTGEGITELFDTIIKVYENNTPNLSRHIHINHGREVEHSIDRIKLLIQKNPGIRYKYSTRNLAIKYLEKDSDIENIVEKLPNRDEIIAARFEESERINSLLNENPGAAITEAKYAFVEGAVRETYKRATRKRGSTISEKIDAIVTNRILAFPIFILLLYLVFQGTFTIGDYPVRWIEWFVDKVSSVVSAGMPAGWVRDLIVDGIIGGVGSVLVFLPNILLLYMFISLLEDSGYMARAAFIMDKLMHRMGLHGKSFIPMVMGFGCNVPAVMACRA